MKTWVRKTLSVGVLTAGALLLAPTAAQAADIQQASTSEGDTDGILNNAAVAIPIDVPVNACAIAVGVLGDGEAAAECSNEVASHSIEQGAGGGDVDGIANNIQVAAPINIPVNVIGVAAGVLGDGHAEGIGKNGSSASTESAVLEHGAHGQGAGGGDVDGIANNLQVMAPIHVPVNVGGVAVGDAQSAAKLHNGGSSHGGAEGAAIQQSAGGGDVDGVLNNASVAVPIDVPINLCGVAVGLLGDAQAAAECSNPGGGWGESIMQSAPEGETDGVLNNLQVAVPINVPINICGIAAGVLGDGEAAAQCSNGGDEGNGVSPEGPDSEYPGDDEEPVDEEPVDEEPVDEEPTDEEPVDEEPVDEEPVDEEPVDDGSGDPSGDYDGVDSGDYDDETDATAGRHSQEALSLPGLSNGSAANLAGLPTQDLLGGLQLNKLLG